MSTSPVSTALLAALSKAFVVLPIALTTTTGLLGSASRKEFTAAPCGASHRMHRTCRTIPAHRRTCSPPPTEVPPNFMISNCWGPALAAQKNEWEPSYTWNPRCCLSRLGAARLNWCQIYQLGVFHKLFAMGGMRRIHQFQTKKKRLLPIADSNLVFSIFSQILHILTSQGQE